MAHFRHTLDVIERGMTGGNEGLSHGLSRISYFVPGVQKGNIYLIGGVTGSGKSALAMDMFACNPYDDYLLRSTTSPENPIKLKIFIWSLEISPEILLAKMICRKMFLQHGILTDINYILSRGKNRVSAEIYDLVKSYAHYYEEFEDRVIINGADNPTGIRNTLLEYLKAHGNIEEKIITIKNRNHDTGEITESNRPIFGRYKPDHDNTYIIVIVDHVNILKKEQRFSKKETVDKLMEYMMDMSNKYKITPIIVQQLNRNIELVDRMKMSSIEPQISDFKETSDSTDAAHFIFGMSYPQRWEIGSYRGYDLTKLGNRFRGLKLLKNRDGNADVLVGLKFLGEIGTFKELPPGKEMSEQDYINIQSITKSYDHSITNNSIRVQAN